MQRNDVGLQPLGKLAWPIRTLHRFSRAAQVLFCNKGMASARPPMQRNECWASAPEGSWHGPYSDSFTKLFSRTAQALFCNKGMASARPPMQRNECWASAPEGSWHGPYGLFTKLFSRAATSSQNTRINPKKSHPGIPPPLDSHSTSHAIHRPSLVRLDVRMVSAKSPSFRHVCPFGNPCLRDCIRVFHIAITPHRELIYGPSRARGI